MRLTKQNIERNGSGAVTLIPEDPEDMWHCYNLIRPADIVKATTLRRVVSKSEAGDTTSRRIKLTLQIRVKTLDFDAQLSQLHINGQIMNETSETKIGQYHTLDLELAHSFTLEKEADGESLGWDSVAIDALRDAVDISGKRRAEAIAIVMQEGLAHICFIGQFQTLMKQKIETSVPRKRHGTDHEKAMTRFYQHTQDALLRQCDPDSSSTTSSSDMTEKPLLLASPGFVAAGFLKHMQATVIANPNSPLKNILKHTVVVHCSSGYTHALAEVLKSPSVQSLLSDTKYARETVLMDSFFEHLRKETNKATYGPREVEKAVDLGAVGPGGGVLIISNRLFRANDIRERQRWVALVDRVRDVEKGEVRILSSDHESGKRLEGLGGIAALLTYPLPELDEGESDEEEDYDDNGEAY
ncbi:Translation release factor pelota-like protein [Ascosphaera apis ARSEF 7405]|uniref:Protein DOM34 homolog n=1 Tax=Ascosphaera apis ARSEF 7405 TaxID=392613 RepID=A0A162I4S0_9EURO|nr:Translation release factor pelota-like protein [Ascosphaera apis ARSEF 7405]